MTDPADGAGPAELPSAGVAPRRFGVDVGGTKLRTALGAADGTILAERVEPTVRDSAGGLIERIVEALDHLRAEAAAATDDQPIGAAGIALPVAVDPVTGQLDSFHNLPGLAGAVHLRADLEVALGMPVAIDNDANAAALAERAHGAARGVDDVVVIAIGTGIGLGIIAGGSLVRGVRGMAGEIGFLPLGSADPTRTPDGATPAYEALVAGPGLRRRIDAAVQADPATRLSIGATLGDTVAIAAGGDPTAMALVDEEAHLIALGIAAVVALDDPELDLLSGGVESVARLIEPVRRHVSELVRVAPRIETGLLGERGPLVGALELARLASRG